MPEWQPKKAVRSSPVADRKDARDLLSDLCNAEKAVPRSVNEPENGATVAGSGISKTAANKLKRKSEFDEVKASGLKWNDTLFTFLAAPSSGEEKEPRCGIICSRRFHKRAVVRNRARRILWEAFRLTKENIPPCWIVMIPRRKICSEKMPVVKAHLETIIPWLEKHLRKSASPAPPQDSSSL